MKNIKLMNRIAAVGTDRFDRAEFNVGEDVSAPDAIMVRSAALHAMEFNPELLAIARCGANCEITRFKGLGEIDKEDFKGFIGEDMRLTPVTCSDDSDVEKTIKFYMGANTPERKDYIMDNLVCDSSEF